MPAPKRSKIGYCDYSGGDLNVVLGCTPVSAGCANCYARRIYERFGKDFTQVTVYPEKLERLLKWQPKPPFKRGPGSRPLAFVCDMSDLFHADVPRTFILIAIEIMEKRGDIDWLLLTKRPKRMSEVLWRLGWWSHGHTPANIWLGVTVENEDNLWRIDELLKTPATVRWVSLEPMLGPIELGLIGTIPKDISPSYRLVGDWIDWIVIGAESGLNGRPFEKEWAWDVLDQCREANVACFLKQDSGARPGVPLLDREGREVKEWPEPAPRKVKVAFGH